MATRIVIGNNKGGSGKTVTTTNVAAALAELGRTVLVVDMDPQANATRRLGFKGTPDQPTVSEAIHASTPGQKGAAADAVYSIGWPGIYGERIDIVPARYDLENRVSEAGTVGAAGRLRRALSGVDEAYDVTLLDCPPSLGHLTILAMAAADAAIATVEPEYDSVDGGVRYREFIEMNGEDLGNSALYLMGIVVGRVRANITAHAFQLGGLKALFGSDLVWEPTVPERSVIKDAADAALPLNALAGVRASATAEIFTELAEKIDKGRR